MDAKYIEVTTTVPNERQAIQLTQIIVSRKLAASVQVSGPFKNTFWWNKRLESYQEYKCSFKTSVSLYPKLKKELHALHPCSPAEIVAFPITEGLDEYFQWLKDGLDLREEEAEDADYTENDELDLSEEEAEDADYTENDELDLSEEEAEDAEDTEKYDI